MPGVSVRPVTVSTTLNAEPGTVRELVFDTRNDPLWCPNVDTARQVSGDGVEPGAEFEFSQHLDRPGGSRVEFEATVEVVSVDGDSIVWKVEDRFQIREIEMSIEPAGDRTRLTQTTRATFHKDPGLAKWVYPLLAKRTFKQQFAHLADYLSEDT